LLAFLGKSVCDGAADDPASDDNRFSITVFHSP